MTNEDTLEISAEEEVETAQSTKKELFLELLKVYSNSEEKAIKESLFLSPKGKAKEINELADRVLDLQQKYTEASE